jgi:hypothetical protein
MSYARGRAGLAAGQGLHGIGSLLLGLDQRQRDETSRQAMINRDDEHRSRAEMLALMGNPAFETVAPPGPVEGAALDYQAPEGYDAAVMAGDVPLPPAPPAGPRVQAGGMEFRRLPHEEMLERETARAEALRPPAREPEWRAPPTIELDDGVYERGPDGLRRLGGAPPRGSAAGGTGPGGQNAAEIGRLIRITTEAIEREGRYGDNANIERVVGNIWPGGMDQFRQAQEWHMQQTGFGGVAAPPPPPDPNRIRPGVHSPAMMEAMATGGEFAPPPPRPSAPVRTPLSGTDRAKARTDPGFRAWLESQGYSATDWR